MQRKLVSAIIASLLLITIILLVWRRQATNKQLHSVTIGTFSKAMGNSPYYIARHFRWFEDDPNLKGVRIDYREFNDRPSINDAIDKGALQVLFIGDAPGILTRAQGSDIRVVAVSGNAKQEILVGENSILKSIGDLRAKRVAVLQATSSQYCLLKILKDAGMSSTDVSLVYMPPAEAKVAFESGQIDAWAVWAPWVEQQQVSGKGRPLVGSEALINNIMVLPEPLIRDHKDVAQSVVSVIQRAKVWMLSHPDEAEGIVAQELGLDVAVVKKAWPKFNWSAQLDDVIISDLQAKATFLADQQKSRQNSAVDIRRDFADLQIAASR